MYFCVKLEEGILNNIFVLEEKIEMMKSEVKVNDKVR